MPEPTVAGYGAWRSPIASDLIVRSTIRLGQMAVDGQDVYWVERRPSEGGRHAIVRYRPGTQPEDVLPRPYNARTRVHEYGGGEFVVQQGTLLFSNDADQRLYRPRPGTEPEPLTPEAALRFADGIIDPGRNRVVCVREDHRRGSAQPQNTLVSIDLTRGGEGDILVAGNDFYSSPRLSPDGSHLAWLTWNHPNMPWDGCELWLAAVRPDGSLSEAALVAGGPSESIFQPEWSPDGTLYFASDRTGWWNLYRMRGSRVEPLWEKAAEFGTPQWSFGMSLYAFESPGRLVCTYTEDGNWYLAAIDTRTREVTPIDVPYTDIREVRCLPGHALIRAGSPTEATSIVTVDLASGEQQVLRRSSDLAIDPGYLSQPEPVEFPTEHGLTAYGFYYPPANADFRGPVGELPPLLVMSHGGPTGATSTTLDPSLQYWTSRGIAVLDVNYGGSSGYGRSYRQRLNGQWGIVDVDDCVNGARYLAERSDVDSRRLAITGGSAGGYTTLCALTFRDVFRAGASHYGIGDLEAMATETHKFESRYLDTLIGPYPERRDLYYERSPIHFTEQLSCPVIFFQGLEDKVVPPDQAEAMVQALREKGLPVAYLAFEGEQHGFRRAENIRRTLDAELYFYARVFGFQLAEPIEPVEIDNL